MTPSDTSQSPGTSRDSTETAMASVENLRDEAVDTAKNIKDQAADEAIRRGEAGKETVADEISDMGNALRRASDELRSGSPQERSFGQMAGALADLSDTVREKDLGEIAGDLSDFARRNPLAFLGGAALLGFAGTRLARASQRTPRTSGRTGSGSSADETVHLTTPWNGDTDAEDEELEAAITGRHFPTPGSTGETS